MGTFCVSNLGKILTSCPALHILVAQTLKHSVFQRVCNIRSYGHSNDSVLFYVCEVLESWSYSNVILFHHEVENKYGTLASHDTYETRPLKLYRISFAILSMRTLILAN